MDDDEKILVANAAALAQDGYDVRTARDGFEALALLRGGIPDLMISDLKMPNMSGFELLGVVRKRFPRIAVITLSREFAPATPPRVIADRHLQKGKTSLADLKQAIRELLAESPIRAQHARFPAATWIPRSTNGYVIMTCSECLRPFSVPVGQLEFDKPATEECPNCGQDVHYSIEPTVAAAEVVPPSVLQESNTRIRAAIDEALKASQELRERVQRAEATSRRTDERIDRTETRMHESESRILRRARRK